MIEINITKKNHHQQITQLSCLQTTARAQKSCWEKFVINKLADGTYMVPTVFTHIHKEKRWSSKSFILKWPPQIQNLYTAAPCWGSLRGHPTSTMQAWQKKSLSIPSSHCLGMNYYVNFLGGTGSNGFDIKWIFGTEDNWKNQNPRGNFGATS